MAKIWILSPNTIKFQFVEYFVTFLQDYSEKHFGNES